MGSEFKIDLSTSGLSISEKTPDLSNIHNQYQRIDDRLKTIEAERQKNIDKVMLYALQEAERTQRKEHKVTCRTKVKREVGASGFVGQELEIRWDQSNENQREVQAEKVLGTHFVWLYPTMNT